MAVKAATLTSSLHSSEMTADGFPVYGGQAGPFPLPPRGVRPRLRANSPTDLTSIVGERSGCTPTFALDGFKVSSPDKLPPALI